MYRKYWTVIQCIRSCNTHIYMRKLKHASQHAICCCRATSPKSRSGLAPAQPRTTDLQKETGKGVSDKVTQQAFPNSNTRRSKRTDYVTRHVEDSARQFSYSDFCYFSVLILFCFSSVSHEMLYMTMKCICWCHVCWKAVKLTSRPDLLKNCLFWKLFLIIKLWSEDPEYIRIVYLKSVSESTENICYAGQTDEYRDSTPWPCELKS